MPNDFARNLEGQRFIFGGMKVNARPDALPPGKYPLAVNVRAYSDGTIQTRPGSVIFDGNNIGAFITDMRAYTALGTDNNPRIISCLSNGDIFVSIATFVGSIPGASVGMSLIPFRPNESPSPWMYVANANGYQKFSAPSPGVTQQKVGIAEPQSAPDAKMNVNSFPFGSSNPGWVHGGTAGAVSNGFRVQDTSVAVFADPALPNNDFVYTVQVHSTKAFQKFMSLDDISGSNTFVTDVFPALPLAVAIQGIFYFSGTTGHCIIVPNNLNVPPGESSVFSQFTMANLRRGSLITFAGGIAETCYVLSVSQGPGGALSIETSTVNNHTTAETITSPPAIQVVNVIPVGGGVVNESDVTYQVTMGVGTQTATVIDLINPFVSGGAAIQPDDYITFGILVDNLSNLTEMKFLIDVGDGSFTENFYYYTVRPSDIQAAIANAATQLAVAQTTAQHINIDAEIDSIAEQGGGLGTTSGTETLPGSNQWTQIVFPISAMTRVGNDQTKTVQNMVNVQFLWNASGTINVATDVMLTVGGFQLDVGDVGAPYQYRVRPRSSLTGVVGNPSPASRYGVNPRRGQVFVNLPSAAYDGQIDTWDVFRYGGSVTEYRFVGSTPSSNTLFTDNFSDDAAGAGAALDFDNFEPWPSVDTPNTGTAPTVNGTIVVVTTTDTDILTYLPGTLIQLGGQNVYTLWNRPTLISGNNYLIQLVENAGAGTNVPYIIQEPFLANRHLPYLWGPDASGTVFGCGDSFRPGTISFAKNYAPDQVPDSFNQEISPPSEPLMGGETLDGLAFVASSQRWWALYPQPQDPAQRYSVVQQPVPRGLAAPFGHCTDGRSIYFWAKDGIWSTTEGSLTDEDLYDLFPHEGVQGVSYTYNGVTIPAPDYSRAVTFRLSYANGYLYAVYQDSGGAYRNLTLDIKRKAWCADVYSFAGPSGAMSCIYQVEQPESTLLTSGTLHPMVLMAQGVVIASIGVQTNGVNDLGSSIACTLALNEWDAGDLRAPKQWGDYFLDLIPAAVAGVSATPMSQGGGVAAASVVGPSTSRTRAPLSVGGTVVSDFLGLFLQWTDDYTVQIPPTKLFSWQPSFVVQPARTIQWATFGTAFGLDGYMHIRQLSIAYVSTTVVTVQVTSYDGQSPASITLPSTGGVYKKRLFPLPANKGQLFKVSMTSAQPFQVFSEDSDVYVGGWGRSGPYATPSKFAGSFVQPSPV